VAAPAAAQNPDSLVASGIRSYRALDFDAAAGFLMLAHRALADRPDTALRATALLYLGATEVYRGRVDSAQAFFSQLVRLDPSYRVDRLVFPPEVTNVFDAARRVTPAVGGRFPRESRFQAGTPGFAPVLLGSTFHQIRVEVQQPDASVLRRVYAGPVTDSLAVTWDGRSVEGQPLASGGYFLVVTSLDAQGEIVRILRVPLDVTNLGADTLPIPLLPEAELLPERQAGASGRRALIGGILLGVTTVALPSLLASDGSLSAGRYAVGGAMVALGVVGFLRGRAEVPIEANIAVNDSIRADWQRRADDAQVENARRLAAAPLRIRVGIPQVIEQESR
jgi:hypothetical protein